MTQTPQQGPGQEPGGTVELQAREERRLIRPGGSARHVDFVVRAGALPANHDRPHLRVALVLDRSGSMSGAKIETAKQAAIAIMDRLDERDQLAVVAFDDQIDVLQTATVASPAVKERLRSSIGALQARASTALHEGWLTGCNAIVEAHPTASLARCLLLTDGMANVGITDPEQIASAAAGIRAHTGIGTSTFGIGEDYEEALLGPMAVAGAGQFVHLREPEEIMRALAGELGELFAVAAARVQLELALGDAVRPEIVSQYPLQAVEGAAGTWLIEIGDLISDDERHIVVRMHFGSGSAEDVCRLQARIRWVRDGEQHSTSWQECSFVYAPDRACDQEVADPAVLHWVGLHHAARASFEAAALNQRGKFQEARQRVAKVVEHIAEYAGSDSDLLTAVAELQALEIQVAAAPMPSMAAKEQTFKSQATSRGQRDHRGS